MKRIRSLIDDYYWPAFDIPVAIIAIIAIVLLATAGCGGGDEPCVETGPPEPVERTQQVTLARYCWPSGDTDPWWSPDFYPMECQSYYGFGIGNGTPAWGGYANECVYDRFDEPKKIGWLWYPDSYYPCGGRWVENYWYDPDDSLKETIHYEVTKLHLYWDPERAKWVDGVKGDKAYWKDCYRQLVRRDEDVACPTP